jgi:hypothetical protein
VRCNECPHWTGRRNSKWSDCYRVVGTLVPDFDRLYTRFGFLVVLPFDPHDTKYLLENLPRPHNCDIPEGVRIQSVKEKDIWFDDDGNERTKNVRLDFYQTHKDYYCGYEKM